MSPCCACCGRAALFADLPVRRADHLLIGALFDRVVMTRVVGRAIPGQSILVAMIIGTVGLSYVLKGAVRVIPYTEEVRAPAAVLLRRADLHRPGGAAASGYRDRGRGGRHHGGAVGVLQLDPHRQGAARHQPEPARRGARRHPVRVMSMTAWGPAAALAGVAGILLAPKLLITPDIAPS